MKGNRKSVSVDILYKIIDNKVCKLCSRCEEYKPMDEENYSKNKSNKRDGFHPYCKPCNSKKSRQWEIDNPEKYKALNKTKIPSKNPVRLERCREFNKKDQAKEYMTEWRNNNKDKLKVYGEKQQNKKHDITDKQWINCKIYFENCCAYCGLHIDNHYRRYAGKQQKIDLHREHVVHNGSNKIDNCIPSCLNCNSSKHDHDFEKWYSHINVNYSVDRINKIHKWLQEDWMLIQ